MFDQFQWTPIGLERNRLLRQYEPIQPHVFLLLAKEFKATAFVDIGANIGTYSLFSTGLETINTVISFEPAPKTFEELYANIVLNGRESQIAAMNCGLSSANGELKFAVVHDYSGANCVVDTAFHDVAKAKLISVRVATLDSIEAAAPLIGERVAIKLDVEGHELEVLSGAADFLARNDVLLQVESYHRHAGSPFPTGEGAERWLTQYGFRYHFHLGADQYWSKGRFELSERMIREILEKSVDTMIEYSRGERNYEKVPPIRRKIFPGLALEATGELALRLRTFLGR